MKRFSTKSASVNFGKINTFYLMGGGTILLNLARTALKKGYSIIVFTSQRHLEENFFDSDQGKEIVLYEELDRYSIEYRTPGDINVDKKFIKTPNEDVMAVGFGETFTFLKSTVDLFQGRLLDFMGIRLPQYRGGAHYTWQILRGNRIGASNLQLINENMVQGEFDSGMMIKTREFLFPANARIPQDYFDGAIKEHKIFIKEFIEELEAGKNFQLSPVPEQYSIFFDRLHSRTHALIDWSWSTKDIESFICAFDDPYPGAFTFLDGRKVHLKKCYAEYNDGPFHPFQSGLVYKVNSTGIYVASRDGTILITSLEKEDGENIIETVSCGDRFFSPREKLEQAMLFKAKYDAAGLISEPVKNGR